MQLNFTTQSLFRKIALTSVLLPILSFTQLAHAVQPPSNIENKNNDYTPVITALSPSSETKNKLMAKLSKLAFFSADFTQQILNEQGDVLLQGAGSLAINKPNLIHWKTTKPDETLIVSDGNTLWFYDPFIEQATAHSLAKSIHNTPILLLTSDEPQLWQQYNVIETDAIEKENEMAGNNANEASITTDNVNEFQDDNNQDLRFVIIPKDESSQIKKLILNFTETITNNVVVTALSEFSFQDATGQISQITLSNFTSTTQPDKALFTFTLPEGVRLEDKR